jgi:hypothetical protein
MEIEIGDLVKMKSKTQLFHLNSIYTKIPFDELFLVVPTPTGHNNHPDYVWVEPIAWDAPPHQLYLEYLEKVND